MKTNRWLIFLLIAGIVVSGAGGYYFGKTRTAAAYEAAYEAEKERQIQINRSDLIELDRVEDTIYVTGHKSPDSDTVGSSIAYAALLTKLGYEAVPVVLGDLNNETKYVLKEAGVETPMLLESAAGCTMALVDHNDYSQSAEGLEDAFIVSTIDHHGEGTVTTGNPVIYDARPIGSTATIIWMRYHAYGVEIDPQTAFVMVGSILSDTHNLKSDAATFADKEALKELSQLAGMSDVDAFYTEMYKQSLSYEGMTDEEIFFSDYKEYDRGITKFGIGCINAYDEEAAKDLVERIKKILPSTKAPTGMDMEFAQISIFHDDISVTYIVPSDEAAADVIEAAFGDRAVFDGSAYVLEPGISRKKVLVPAISEVLDAYPKE